MGTIWLQAATLIACCILISAEECNSIEQPDDIDVIKQDETQEWLVTFRYPAVNFNVSYKCPNNNRQGSLFLVASILSETATAHKELYYEGVPGVKATGILLQSVPHFSFDVYVTLDKEGFVFTGICYTKQDKETKLWNAEAQTHKDFPFLFTDSGQLRFDMNQCNVAQPT